MSEIVYEQITVARLADYAKAAASRFPHDGIVAISQHRAQAHGHNPDARPDDVALIVARRGGVCVGYVGLVPGVLRTPVGPARVHYISTWNVSDEARGSGIGPKLIEEAMHGRDLIGTGSSDLAIKRFLKMGFVSPVLRYCRIDLTKTNLLGRALKRLRPGLAPAAQRWASPIVERAARTVKTLLYSASRRMRRTGMSVAYELPALDQFDVKKMYGFHRSDAVIHWMLDHPWVLVPAVKNFYDNSYRFTSYAERFEYRCFSLELGQNTIGYAICSAVRKSDRTIVKLLDHASHRNIDGDLLSIVLRYAATVEADQIEIPEALRACFSSTDPIKRLARPVERAYFCRPASDRSPLAMALPHLKLAYGDADIPYA